jgi:hypothetical protein
MPQLFALKDFGRAFATRERGGSSARSFSRNPPTAMPLLSTFATCRTSATRSPMSSSGFSLPTSRVSATSSP